MDELLSIINNGGASKQEVPTVIHPSKLGRRNYKIWFRCAALCFGVLFFLSLGSVFESIKLLRYLVYLALIAFVLFYNNPRLQYPLPRLLLGVVISLIVELFSILVNGGV